MEAAVTAADTFGPDEVTIETVRTAVGSGGPVVAAVAVVERAVEVVDGYDSAPGLVGEAESAGVSEEELELKLVGVSRTRGTQVAAG